MPPVFPVQQETATLRLPDGVELVSDLYRPESAGDVPVLLMRQPYGRAIASTVVYAHPRWYAAHGYLVVIQDVRGRGDSGGEFRLFEHEVEDGVATVNWAAQLPGSDGQVGMYGFSYQGMTQLYAASGQPAALRVLCPGMLAVDLYDDWAYENGAFCLQASLGWAVQLAAETARLQGDRLAYHTLYAASRDLPIREPSLYFRECLRKYTPSNFYEGWCNHPEPGEYWQQFVPDLTAVDLPMLHIGGWFDPYLRGTLRLYQDMAARARSPQHLLIGPWAHLPWSRRVGDADFGPEAASPVDTLQLRWFDQFLKGQERGIRSQMPVKLFELGPNRWREFDTWPPAAERFHYHLHTTGLASMREDAGTLHTQPPEQAGEDVLVHDPWRPVPARGGHAASPAGAFERSALDTRSDVLTYTTAPLAEALSWAGVAIANIHVQTEANSFDLCAILSDVHPDGRVFNLCQGYTCVRVVRDAPIRLPLQACCARIAVGHCLRLSLSAACFPAYPVNPGTGKPTSQADLMLAQVVTLRVQCGGDRASQLQLPVVAAGQECDR
ncbi:MAG: CocE/NonD family hydrolase [Spirulinaceae cyanobacterium SM2_1_0]|nr:CocE/NonD family hydrolase [Spirulinaceae cyanobacterium SM2_1_0]